MSTYSFEKEKSWPRDLLRQGASDQEMLDVIGLAVSRKKKQHAGK